ncbi:MAG: molybdopterin synthase sulfur carrier subunit [Planctomycetota bacterium]|jgi:molybdopterin synthase sulfur carrier subunit
MSGSVRVSVASILFEYTGGERELEAKGRSVLEVLRDLDRRHRGFLFRIVDEQARLRPHIKVSVNGAQVRDLGRSLNAGADLHILQALSGG